MEQHGETIVLDLSVKGNYTESIDMIRATARASPTQESHGIPLLPVAPDTRNPLDAEYLALELRTQSHTLNVRIRRHDMYLLGFQTGDGTWFEFRRQDDVHLIPGSEYLPFNENYRNLGGTDAGTFRVDRASLGGAINGLANPNTDDNSRKGYLRLLCIMICEAARFPPLQNHFSEVIESNVQQKFLDWMDTLIHSWGDLCDRVLRSDAFWTIPRLPNQQNGEPNLLTQAPINIVNGDWYSWAEALGLIARFTVYTTSRPPRSIPNYYDNIFQGTPMVEVFSVCINNIDGEDPGQLYGTVRVTDGLGSFFLYNRGSDNYEEIRPGETASLEGPYRSISLCQQFTLELDLKDHDTLSFDDEISKGYVSHTIFYLSTNRSLYNRPLSTVIQGAYGSATVYYAMLERALEATIEVILIDGDHEDPAQVYGTISASYDWPDNLQQEDQKYYETVLFKKPSKGIDVKEGSPIPLSRSVVVVPTNGTLNIKANLWDYDYWFYDDEIVSDTAKFVPLPDHSTKSIMTGEHGEIEVRVTWSPISGGPLQPQADD